jgi:GGDEF domain-containing protein
VTDEREQPPLHPARAELLSRAARAARELCELLWDAMGEELRHPREQRVRALSERLSEVSATIALLASSRGGERPVPGEPAPGEHPTPEHTPPRGSDGERRTPPEPIWREHSPPSPGPPLPPPIPHPAAYGASTADAERARMRLVDEHQEPSPSGSTPQARSPDAMSSEYPPSVIPPREAPGALYEVRHEEGPSAWVNTVGRLLERHAVDGFPFAVLLVELVDIARIEHSEAPFEFNRLIVQVEHALCAAMRAEDTLTRESLGRYWLVAPHTNGTGARMLAERLAQLVRASASHRGAPLEVAIGIAVCPEDGTHAPGLAARADLGVYSARATGRSVVRPEPPA